MRGASRLWLALAIWGCGGRTGVIDRADGSAGPDDSERDGRFVGTWLVDQPSHALYEYTLYAFSADGTIERGANCWPGSPEGHGETGSVQKGDLPLRCTFSHGWESFGEETLAISAACSDGQNREIVLSFASPPGQNGEGAVVEVTEVGGEAGWGHGSPEWRWLRCIDGEPCEPTWCPYPT
jgi:hypothetical protein